MKTHKQRGGSQIGWVSASWPLAGIEVSPNKLSIRSMGEYHFAPSEVTAVEKVGSLPFFTTGVRIHHSKSQYPERIVFYPGVGRDYLLTKLHEAGFSLGQPTHKISRGFPLRIPTVIALVVLWNVLFLLDRPNQGSSTGGYSLAALAGVFALATMLPHSERLQNLFMRKDRDVGEISSFLRLVQLVTGIILIVSLTTYLAQ